MRTGVLIGGPDCGRTFPVPLGSVGLDLAQWRDGDTYYHAATNGDRVYYVHPDCLGLADRLAAMFHPIVPDWERRAPVDDGA